MTPDDERCMAVTGGVWVGPQYCGHPSKTRDANGRPVCGIHKDGQPGIEWLGARGRYPHGVHGSWQFRKGPDR